MIRCASRRVLADAHLDLAYNAVRGRDVTRPAVEQTPDKEGTPTVGLPDLHAGGVRLVCATIFCEPDADPPTGFRTPQQAHEAAERQWAWYRERETDGLMRFVRSSSEVPDEGEGSKTLLAILLMEGADPLRTQDDVG